MKNDRRDPLSAPGLSGDAEDRLGELLRLAGRRPPVPAERRARVEDAVRAHWRAELRRRRTRRWISGALAAAATLALVAGIGSWRRATVETPTFPAKLDSVARSVWLRSSAGAEAAGRPAAARPGTALPEGSELATESDGRAALRMASGHSVRLDHGTRVRVIGARTLLLERGAVYVDSGVAQASGEPLEIRTPFGVLRDVGTQFEARLLAESLRLRVREGRVVVGEADRGIDVHAGGEIELDADGRIERREVAAADPAWDWIGEVTPMMDVRGRSLREFLDWIARERGLRLDFAQGGLADAAGSITLNGSVAGLSLDQALDAVLPTCRMRHRIEGGALIVLADSENGGA